MRKLLFFLLILFLPSKVLYAQYDWQALPSAPTTPYRFDDIFFLTPNLGWAVKPIGGTVLFGEVWETRDGGNNWIRNNDSSQTYYRCVGFKDSLNGWIGNLADSSISNDSVPLYYTHDGGKTLHPVIFSSPKPKGICGISVVTDSVVYAYGRYYGPPVLAMTKDGGKNWTTKDMSSYASVGLIDGWFWSKDTGFITGQNGANSVILHTVDGGNSWQTVYEATRNDTDHVWKIVFPSRDTGYGSIENTRINTNSTSNRYFVKTINGGKTWTEYAFIANYDEEGIGFINNNVGWIGGWSGLSYITTDGGMSWKLDSNFGVMTVGQFSGPLPYINRFRKFGDTLMYAAGNTIYTLNTKLTGINEVKKNKTWVINYPNPFKNKTTISYILARPCKNVLLAISDETGKKIAFKNLGFQNVGQNHYVFDSDLPAGVYYYSITTSDGTISGKMVTSK